MVKLDTFEFRRPFDTHVHGRDGDLLKAVAPLTARQFWGAIFEPNLEPPIVNSIDAREYKERIRSAVKDENPVFVPYALLYFTDTLTPQMVADALADRTTIGVKFYPRGATTNSDRGIGDVTTLYTKGTRQFDVIREVAACDKVVQLHCELNYDLKGNELDPYDKEDYFFKQIMRRLIDAHPNARFSCEHLTTLTGASFMDNHGDAQVGCSITPHHLLYDRRDMFRGGLRPHLFCLPVIKPSKDREALLELVKMNYPFVYAGTDSAPHDRRKKECDCCSGGVFTAHAAVELYATAFEEIGALDHRFENFMSVNGPMFYRLKPRSETITLQRYGWAVNETIQYSALEEDVIVPHGFSTKPTERRIIPWKLKA